MLRHRLAGPSCYTESLQTQEIFHWLVKDTITQGDPVKAISDMRLAIKNTNVVLNMAITPGIMLIPSDVIILMERVVGYNNVLTLGTEDMKFGVDFVHHVVLTKRHLYFTYYLLITVLVLVSYWMVLLF